MAGLPGVYKPILLGRDTRGWGRFIGIVAWAA